MPVLGISEQVLHRLTSPLLQVSNPFLFLTTMTSTTLQGDLKDSFQQGVAWGHMARSHQLLPFHFCK